MKAKDKMKASLKFTSVLSLIFLLAAEETSAQLYKYIDENGETQIVDSQDKIPPALREKAIPLQDNSGKSNLQVVPSEDSSAGSSAVGVKSGGKKSCKLSFSGKHKKTDASKKNITYYGTVVNRGSGTAKGIRVTMTIFDKEEKTMDELITYATPKDLEPKASADFEFRMDLSDRRKQWMDASYYGSKFTVSYDRCD